MNPWKDSTGPLSIQWPTHDMDCVSPSSSSIWENTLRVYWNALSLCKSRVAPWFKMMAMKYVSLTNWISFLLLTTTPTGYRSYKSRIVLIYNLSPTYFHSVISVPYFRFSVLALKSRSNTLSFVSCDVDFLYVEWRWSIRKWDSMPLTAIDYTSYHYYYWVHRSCFDN